MEVKNVCRVYEYGCLPPISGEAEMLDQMVKRNKLWNDLVTIERDFRARSQELITPENTEFNEIDKEIETLREQIKERRKSARKSVDISDLKIKIKELSAQKKEAYAAYKETRKSLIEKNKEQLKILDNERKEKVKEAYHNSQLYWGNYNDVINNSYNVARIRAMKAGVDLKYQRFDGTGKVTVQIQGGLSTEDVFKQGTLLQIQPVDPYAWICPIRAERKKLCRSVVKIRVGSDGRSPIWLELPFVMHRPLPENGTIKAAAVIREKIGNKYRYKLTLTVMYPQHIIDVTDKDYVALNLGWRMVKEGLRVAYWCDSKGDHGQLVLSNDILNRFKKLDDLKSIRSNHFNDAVEVLKTWKKDKSVPEWLQEETKSLAQWKSPGNFKRLVNIWKDNRFAGDQEIVSYLEEYIKRENHLWLWETNLRDKIFKRRREEYRIFAAKLASKYSAVALEKYDLRKVTEKPNPEAGTSGTTPASRNRTIASISTLREIIDSTFSREGKAVISVDSKDITSECHKCGHTEKFESDKNIYHTCSACGEIWDQDHNAAINNLRRGFSVMCEP